MLRLKVPNNIKYNWNIIFADYDTNFDFNDEVVEGYRDLLVTANSFEKKLEKNSKIVALNIFGISYELWPIFPIAMLTNGVDGHFLTNNKFIYPINLYIYETMYTNKLPKPNDSVCVICKHILFLNPILYYQKYINYSHDPDNFYMIVDKQISTLGAEHGYNKDMLAAGKINTIYIDGPMNNGIIDKIVKQVPKKMDLIFVDYTIKIDNMIYFRSNYTLQGTISATIIALESLKVGGNMILSVSEISSKLVMSFILVLATYFKHCIVHISQAVPKQLYHIFVFKTYGGSVDMQKFYDLNAQLYINDPTGGSNYVLTNPLDIAVMQKFDPNFKRQDKKTPLVLSRIFDVDEYVLNTCFNNYQNIIVNNIRSHIRGIHEKYVAQSDAKVRAKKVKNARELAIMYAEKIGLTISDWVNKDANIQNIFYKKKMVELNSNNFLFKYKFTPQPNKKIGLHKSLIKFDESYMYEMYRIGENVYAYVESVGQKKIKQVELTINYYQKRLEKILFDIFDVNINGKYVSRAWIKMYELYSNIKYFDNLISDAPGGTITALHICEAPGNFINATKYYLEKNTTVTKYDWTAQSLKDADIWDEYGFMKETSKQWDFASGCKDCTGTGDITNYNNLLYYYSKYRGVDSLVGDCGIQWSPKNNLSRDLSIFQLIYGLLIPRVGGNFVMKSYSINYNSQFIALLSIVAAKYTKLYAFKSSRNIWSPEIYIVGINKRSLDAKEIDNLLAMAKALTEGTILYPTDKINDNFIMNYEYINNRIVGSYTEMKKIFVYYALNETLFKREKYILEDIMDQKNIQWLHKNMKFLGDRDSLTKTYNNFWKNKFAPAQQKIDK